MELKELKFVEQHLYEKPEDNYYRGINVYINDVKLFSLDLNFGREPITKEEKTEFFLPERYFLSFTFDGVIEKSFLSMKDEFEFVGQRRFLLTDIDDAKTEAKEIVKRYINFFVK